MFFLAVLALATEPPSFDAGGGYFDAPFSLALAPAADGDDVYYGLDGASPTTAYTGPLPISGTTIVKARAVAQDGTPSAEVTRTFLAMPDVLAPLDGLIVHDAVYGPIVDDSLRTLPAISLVTASLSTSESAASFEWIDPQGDDAQLACGLAITGTSSLGYPKNSLRLYFRKQYGEGHLDFELFPGDQPGVAPVDTQDALSLRSGHDSLFYLGAQGQYTRNFWMDESQLAMGHYAPHGRFAHVYLNGSYNGLYHVRERFAAAFLASYLGGKEDDYEAINGGAIFNGTGAAWNQVMAHASDYQGIKAWLDVPDFLDYMVLNYYAGNAWDWSAYHNWAAVGPEAPNRGGFRFESSDSDICLYYDYTINILNLGGPADLFTTLYAEGDPDFRVALADAIHRNLEANGPLTAENAAARYARIAGLIEAAVVPESARWGSGVWDRDDEWVTERKRLLEQYFPYRTDELLRQMREAGWYPLEAPVLSRPPGLVEVGAALGVSVPEGTAAELWVSLNGDDPRASAALGPGEQMVSVDRSTVVKARLRAGDVWGPLAEGFYEVDAPSPIVLNEWNAVDDDRYLEETAEAGSGSDSALGRVHGNGGDWIELLVTEDVDIRGWRITMEDRSGRVGDLSFTADELLGKLRAGTLLTIAEDLPEDAAYDPDGGDWRFHLRAAAGGTGRYISAADFDVTSADWQLTLWDADGHVRFGPVGEGVSPASGLSSHEVGVLEATPGDDLRRSSKAYSASDRSTFGSPNVWDGGAQDLDGLRGVTAGVGGGGAGGSGGGVSVGGGGAPVDPGAGGSAAVPVAGAEPTPEAASCGCNGAGRAPQSGLLWALALVALLWRRRAVLAAVPVAAVLAGCGSDKDVAMDMGGDAGTDAGMDAGGDGPEPVADCFADADHDGHGDPAAPVICGGGAVSDGTDCDDSDPARSPGAHEVCNGVDDDCDGRVDIDAVDALPFYADGDGDGYGDSGAVVLACSIKVGVTLVGGDCDDASAQIHPGALELCDDVDQNCDGTASDSAGSTAECPVGSCLAVREESPGAADGAYWLALPSGSITSVWCDMTTDGGGWTLGFLRNTASTGSQGGFGGAEKGLEELGVSPAAASSSASAALAWLDLEAYGWNELQLGAYGSGGEHYRSRVIPREALRIHFGENGYLLFGGETGYYWCGGDASYTDSGVGAVNNPPGATADCKGHGSLGSGWDFSESDSANAGLTLCGGDGSYFLSTGWGGAWVYYGNVGGAQAIWVR